MEKIEGSHETSHKTEIHWKVKEKIKYIVFIYFTADTIAKTVGKDLWAVFKVMSSFVETKNANQCRIFHKKMMKQFNDISQLLNKTREEVPQFG